MLERQEFHAGCHSLSDPGKGHLPALRQTRDSKGLGCWRLFSYFVSCNEGVGMREFICPLRFRSRCFCSGPFPAGSALAFIVFFSDFRFGGGFCTVEPHRESDGTAFLSSRDNLVLSV